MGMNLGTPTLQHALATIAAMGTASAQVTMTGGVDFGYIKNLAGTSKGFTNWGAYLDFSATEDLGGGMSVAAFMELNADSSRAAAGSVYSGDRSLTLNMPVASLTFANSRSGGNQGAALVGSHALWDDVYAHGVISRANVDAVVLAVPVAAGVKVIGKYVEGAPDYAATPSAATTVLGLSYAGNGLTVGGYFNSSDYNDATKATLPAGYATTSTDLSVVYDAGVAKVGFGYDSARRGKASTDQAATLAGLSIPMGAATVGVNWGKRDAASFYTLGGQYNLSKRTNITAAYGNADSGTKATNEYALILHHSF
jgi:hypothetical protein